MVDTAVPAFGFALDRFDNRLIDQDGDGLAGLARR
jgi:hypothetical protein